MPIGPGSSRTLAQLQQGVVSAAENIRGDTEEQRNLKIEEFDNNQARIQKNLQHIIDKGGSPEDLDSYLKDVEGIEPGVVPQRPKKMEASSALNTGLAFTRGAIKGTSDLVSLPFLLTDYAGYQMRKAFDDEASVNTGLAPIIQGLGDDAASVFDLSKGEDIDRPFVTRATEQVGQLATPGAGIVMGLTRKGAKLLGVAPESLKWWQKGLVDMAKNPKKAQMFEAGLNTGAAVTGEALVTLTVDPNSPTAKEDEGWVRFGGEMAALLGVGVGYGFVSASRKLKHKFDQKFTFTEDSQKRVAEIHVGQIFNDIMEADAVNIKKAMDKADELEAATGVKFFTPDIFQNPDLQNAFEKIVQTGDLAPTKYHAVLMAQRKRMADYIDGVGPVLSSGDNVQNNLKKFLDNEFSKLDKRLDRAERAALNEAEMLHPNRSPVDIGESALEMVKVLEREALDKADLLYQALDDGAKIPTSLINLGVKKAHLNPSFADKNIKRLAQGQEVTDLKGFELPRPVQSMLDLGDLNFGADNPKATIGQIVQYRRLVQDEFRLAGIRGETDNMRRLGQILTGVDNQLKKAARSRSPGGRQAKLLGQANTAYAKTKARFDQSFEAVGIQKDLTNMYTITPEDFSKRFIRPTSRAKSVESAKVFSRIFEDDPQAKALLADAVRFELSKLKKGDTLNHLAVDRWLKNHKENLQAHGLWDEFKDVPVTVANFDEEKIAVGMARKEWERSQLNKVSGVEDLQSFISKKIKSGKLDKTAAKIKRRSKAAGRAFVREVWDNVLGRSETVASDSIGNIIRNPDRMLQTLTKHEKTIRGAVGNDHYKALKEIAEAVKLQEGKVPTFGARPVPESVFPRPNQARVGRAMSKIRASLQGFVSPEFTLVQLANQGLDLLNSRAAQHVVEEAMYDPEYAIQLAKIAKQSGGPEALRLIWLQMTAAGVSGHDAFSEDDPRTAD